MQFFLTVNVFGASQGSDERKFALGLVDEPEIHKGHILEGLSRGGIVFLLFQGFAFGKSPFLGFAFLLDLAELAGRFRSQEAVHLFELLPGLLRPIELTIVPELDGLIVHCFLSFAGPSRAFGDDSNHDGQEQESPNPREHRRLFKKSLRLPSNAGPIFRPQLDNTLQLCGSGRTCGFLAARGSGWPWHG